MHAIINPGTTSETAPYRQYQGGYFRVLIGPEQSGGAMALLDMTLPAGVEPPPHFHTNEDETFYLLEGSIRFQIGDKEITASPGDAVFAPRQLPHHFQILSGQARFLNLITPGQFLAYFLEFSFPATEPAVVPPQGPPPGEAIAAMTQQLTHKYGVLFL